MKRKKLIPIIGLLVIGALFLLACSGDMLTAPGEENSNQIAVAEQEGMPTDQIPWISWTKEFSQRIRALNKSAYASVLIEASVGGRAGGLETFGNSVDIPPNALSEDTEISVSVDCMNETDPCVGVVEFLPDTEFNSDVTITLSYAELDYENSPYDIKIYWTKSIRSNSWFLVDIVNVDTESQTLSFEIDHFTQYSWSL